ncbi:uncharacterized protein [Linepithema humile]|uniref:uncharacterized protein isoform X1 n=1 Tax=Linepithema humile TaxID=83485 RepID=UPI000623012A|nr:PREDICTED: uncharacterized protein LOC105670489 [Linepithema humile]XP_012219456.1 PREDICTED: uncharacterized protein LOC105670489 [Linepithema humile]
MMSQIDDDVEHNLSNLKWKKIGKAVALMIYPLKSSTEPERYSSFDFRDYGMYTTDGGSHFWDGMFIVYNKTKDKFEDSRKYFLLKSIEVEETNINKAILSNAHVDIGAINFDMNPYRNPSYSFTKETWNGTLETHYDLHNEVNQLLKELIYADDINETKQDIILAQMIPSNWDSTKRIKDNWSLFVQGYENIENDQTGRLITLPRFVLMTSRTFLKLYGTKTSASPNIIVNTDESIDPFEEKNWDWIKIGENVILKNIKPVSSLVEEIYQHFGIYCGLWTGGNVKEDDDVFISDTSDTVSTKAKKKDI